MVEKKIKYTSMLSIFHPCVVTYGQAINPEAGGY